MKRLLSFRALQSTARGAVRISILGFAATLAFGPYGQAREQQPAFIDLRPPHPPRGLGSTGPRPPARRPSAPKVPNMYPGASRDRHVGGWAKILCAVDDQQILSGCTVINDFPAGMGFGAAGLKKLRVAWAMRPRQIEGRPQVDGRLMFTVGFHATQRSARPILTVPTWSAGPSFDEMLAAWPAGAGDAAVGGATLRCKVGLERRLLDCRAIGVADPHATLFNAAALDLADRFRVAESPDWKLASGIDVVVSLRFLNPDTAAGQSRRIESPAWADISGLDPSFAPFPEPAVTAGIKAGYGVVDCFVASDGRLADCHVAREDPAGAGFGEAALHRATALRLSVWTQDGRPASGARIKVPILIGPPPQQPVEPRLKPENEATP